MRISNKTYNECKQIATGMCRLARDYCFPCWGSIINDDIISEEITHRIRERK